MTTSQQDMRAKILAYLRYEDGSLFWKEREHDLFKTKRAAVIWNKRFANKKAGSISKTTGYERVCIDWKLIDVHRAIFIMFNDEYPAMVDHIDGNILNNKIENLRVCTNTQNQYNQKTVRSSSGVKGVYWSKAANKWIASIKVNSKLKHLGTFSEKEDAIMARVSAAKSLHGELFNYGT